VDWEAEVKAAMEDIKAELKSKWKPSCACLMAWLPEKPTKPPATDRRGRGPPWLSHAQPISNGSRPSQVAGVLHAGCSSVVRHACPGMAAGAPKLGGRKNKGEEAGLTEEEMVS
jgi:hypothetical protein